MVTGSIWGNEILWISNFDHNSVFCEVVILISDRFYCLHFLTYSHILTHKILHFENKNGVSIVRRGTSGSEDTTLTGMHSSRMPNLRCHSLLLGSAWGVLPREGVCPGVGVSGGWCVCPGRCLPGGCLPGVGVCPGGCLPGGGGVSAQRGGICLGGCLPGGVCPGGVSAQRGVCPEGGVGLGGLSGGCLPDTLLPLWTEWLTDRCKNTALPQLRCGQ